MTCNYKLPLLILILSLVSLGGAGTTPAHAGEAQPSTAAPSETLLKMSLDDLLNIDVTMVAVKPTVQSEAPAVVSIITREEIELSGARDLIDVLRKVPGFDFGVDIWNVVGIGFRGLWGNEGKVLLTVDGMNFNEYMYGNVPYGNHFPVDLIERIEVIRGPGSAKFGNFAELAVINVITMTGAEIPGTKVSSTTGFYDNGFARQNLAAKYGVGLGQDGYLGFSAAGGVAQRSSQTYLDPSGTPWDMRYDSALKDGNVILNFRKGGLTGGFIYDHYQTTGRDGYGTVVPDDLKPGFVSYLGRLGYQWLLTESLKVTSAVKAAIQQPWRNTRVPLSDPTYYDPTVQTYNGSLNALWEVVPWASTQFGVEYEHQLARYGGDEPQRAYLFINGSRSIDFNRYSIYNEWLLETPWVNITAGARLDKYNNYSPAIVPRICLTRTFGDTSVKLLYNRAFRAPSIEQTASGLKNGYALKTETSDVYELEISHRFDHRNHVSLNLYEIRMGDPIVYTYDAARDLDTYQNQGHVGSRGIEAEYRFRDEWGNLAVRYAFYKATDLGAIYYRVPGNDNVFLGFPAHKVTVDGNYQVSRNLNLNTSLIFISDRYGYDLNDPVTGQPAIKRYHPELVTNFYLSYRDAFRKGVTIGFGIFDLFDVGHTFIQPYNGGHAPLPGPGREYLLRISYAFDH